MRVGSGCNTDGMTAFERSLTSRQRLAYLLKRDMGVDVDPGALGEFLKRNWRTISVCAHAIHDEPNPYAVADATSNTVTYKGY